MRGSGITLDQYIDLLQEMRQRVGGDVMCWTDAGDYPEVATGPALQTTSDAYTPAGAVVLR